MFIIHPCLQKPASTLSSSIPDVLLIIPYAKVILFHEKSNRFRAIFQNSFVVV